MDLQTTLIVPGAMGQCLRRVGTTPLLTTAGSQALPRSLLVAQSVKERHLDDFYERVLPNAVVGSRTMASLSSSDEESKVRPEI